MRITHHLTFDLVKKYIAFKNMVQIINGVTLIITIRQTILKTRQSIKCQVTIMHFVRCPRGASVGLK